MIIPGLIITENPAPELTLAYGAHHQLHVDGLDGASPRDAAVHFFGPMVRALTQKHRLHLSPYWRPHLDGARGRLLDRVALALGAVLVTSPVHNPVHRCTPAGSYRGRSAGAGQTPASGAAQPPDSPVQPSGRNPAPCLPAVALGAGAGWRQGLAGALSLSQLRPAYDGPGVGAWRTDGRSILLVGDRPNGEQHAAIKQRIPFFSLHGGGCSLWLAQQLEDAGIPEERLYWINAHSWDGKPTSPDFIEQLNPRHVIALGRNAQSWCAFDAGVNNVLVDHPQHWKRFHHGQPYPFIEALRSVL